MAKPATAVDPQTTFTPAELSQSFQQYRTELIVMPMLAMQAALQHMTARTGIRYQQHVHEMKGNFEIGPYNKYKMGNGDIAIVQRTLETFFGNCIEPIDPNSIVQSLWGSDVTKGEGLKNVPWVKRVCAYIMAQLGEKLFMEMWKAKRNASGTTTHDLFNGFLAIEDIEIAADKMSQEEGNFYELPEAFDGDNTEELMKDWFFGVGSWKGIGPKLRSQKLKLFMSDRTKHFYEESYQKNHGSLPYNQQYQKASLEGAPNVEFVPLANVPDNYLSLTPRTNILSLWNQRGQDETFLVEKSLTSHYDMDFIANLFYGEQYLSINKEMLNVVRFYTAVTTTSGKNPKNEGWYVKSGSKYVLTTDTTPQSGTTYYTL